MKIDKKYLYFKRWFKITEASIHCGQWSDEQIAHAGFTEGIKFKSQQSVITELNEANKIIAELREHIRNHIELDQK